MSRRCSICEIVLFFALALPILAGNETNYTYLALGDSVAFGYDPTVPVFPTLPSPFAYSGYPEKIADALHLTKSKKITNASCPGETSTSFLVFNAVDNGCYGTGPQGQPSFRFSIGLRADYPGSQFAFAMQQLADNKHIDLLTLSLGGNELELIQQECMKDPIPDFATCVGIRLQAMLPTLANNLATILAGFRTQARYKGKIVLVNYYTPSSFELFATAVSAVNNVLRTVSAQFGVSVADVFTAFQYASIQQNGDPCAAGLLVRLDAYTCDIHPSDLGKQIIASTVLAAIGDK